MEFQRGMEWVMDRRTESYIPLHISFCVTDITDTILSLRCGPHNCSDQCLFNLGKSYYTTTHPHLQFRQSGTRCYGTFIDLLLRAKLIGPEKTGWWSCQS